MDGLTGNEEVALVTGASRGIGLACAQAFLEEGLTVIGFDKTDSSEDLVAMHDNYHHELCDVSEPTSLRRLIGEAAKTFGRIDVLVNNAGVHSSDHLIDDISVEEFRVLLETNLVSAFVASQAALPHLRKVSGSIVNIGSLVGSVGQEAAVDYCVTKAGLSGLTKALAIDEAPHGVRVNCVCPGAVRTPLAESLNSPEMLRTIGEWAWMERLGTAEEVAEAVVFLGRKGSAFITGQDLVVSGGAELGYGLKGSAYYRAMGKPVPNHNISWE